MGRKLQAYFPTESDAERMRTRLQAYQVGQLEVGGLTGTVDQTGLLAPLGWAAGTGTDGTVASAGALNEGGTTAPGNAVGSYIGFRALDETVHDKDNDGIDDRELRYALSADVPREDYDEIVNLIRRNNGHVESLDEDTE